MLGLTLRTKFLGGFAALVCMVAALAFTSMRAMSSLNSGLERVVQKVLRRAARTSQLVETVVEISEAENLQSTVHRMRGMLGMHEEGRNTRRAGEPAHELNNYPKAWS